MRGEGWRIDGDGGGSCCAQDTPRKYVASKYSIIFGLFWNPIAFPLPRHQAEAWWSTCGGRVWRLRRQRLRRRQHLRLRGVATTMAKTSISPPGKASFSLYGSILILGRLSISRDDGQWPCLAAVLSFQTASSSAEIQICELVKISLPQYQVLECVSFIN